MRAAWEGALWSTYRYAPGQLRQVGALTPRLFCVGIGQHGQGFGDKPLYRAETNLMFERGRLHWTKEAGESHGPEDDDISPSLEVRSVLWTVTGGSTAERRAFVEATAWSWEAGNCWLVDMAPLASIDGHGNRRQRRALYDAIRALDPDTAIGALHFRRPICIPAGQPFALKAETVIPIEVDSELRLRFTLYTRFVAVR